MDSGLLADMLESVKDQGLNLHSLTVVRDGVIISDTYFAPYAPETRHETASITKSITGTLVGVALQQGMIRSLDDPVATYLSQASDHPDKADLTLRHLLTLQTGLDCDLSITEGQMQTSPDWVGFLLDVPMEGPPGRDWYYCSPAVHLLSAVLQAATGMSTREFANQYLFGPLGIDPASASDWPDDPQEVTRGDIGLWLTPHELAKVGTLYLNEGSWQGAQLLSADWIHQATTTQADKGDGTGYGYLWTTYPGQSHYAALGRGGQQLHVFPDQGLVVVVAAALPALAESEAINHLLSDYILPAARSSTLLPENAKALARLRELETAFSRPPAPQVLQPSIVQQISGVNYAFPDNPVGWSQLRMTFGDKAATATLQDGAYTIGLDGAFRITYPKAGPAIALRGAWLDNRTLELEELMIGTADEYRLTLTYEGTNLRVHVSESVFLSSEFEFEGEATD